MKKSIRSLFFFSSLMISLFQFPSFSLEKDPFSDAFDEPNDHIKSPQDILFESGVTENIASAEFALISGAKINSPDRSLSPIHIAAQYQKVRMIEFFLEKGADVNYKDLMGNNVLHTAIKGFPSTNYLSFEKRDFAQEKNFISLLLSKGVNINEKNDLGLTPLFYCYDKEIFDFLVFKGADSSLTDESGSTPAERCEFFRKAKFEEDLSYWLNCKKHKLEEFYYKWFRP